MERLYIALILPLQRTPNVDAERGSPDLEVIRSPASEAAFPESIPLHELAKLENEVELTKWGQSNEDEDTATASVHSDTATVNSDTATASVHSATASVHSATASVHSDGVTASVHSDGVTASVHSDTASVHSATEIPEKKKGYRSESKMDLHNMHNQFDNLGLNLHSIPKSIVEHRVRMLMPNNMNLSKKALRDIRVILETYLSKVIKECTVVASVFDGEDELKTIKTKHIKNAIKNDVEFNRLNHLIKFTLNW